MKVLNLRTFTSFVAFAALAFSPSGGAAEPGPGHQTELRLLFTNDLHSHFRPGRSDQGLGGAARLRTAIQKFQGETRNTLVLDGGDWSEGNIYYNLGAGTESLGLLDFLGVDATVVGNHDCMNGPDALLDAIRNSGRKKIQVLAANLDAAKLAARADFAQLIPPYFIREFDGIRVAVLGLSNYEIVYDSYYHPVKVLSPFPVLRELLPRLRQEADVILAVSHNTTSFNQQILKSFPDLDFIVGGHDHLKHTSPVWVQREGGHPSFLVEAEKAGRFLGKLDLRLTARASAERTGLPRVTVVSHRLVQMDRKIPEDRETNARLAALERRLENRYGPIFHDRVAVSRIEIDRTGSNNLMGNLQVDAYRAAAGADLALDQINLIVGHLPEGELRSVDFYNANPHVYDLRTGKSWTLKTFNISGKNFLWFLNLLYASKGVANRGVLSASGLSIVYDPLFRQRYTPPRFPRLGLEDDADTQGERTVIREITIGGKTLELTKNYRVAAGGGIIQAIEILNSLFPGAVPLASLRDTGQEDWRTLVDYVRSLSPITRDSVSMMNRIRSYQANLGILYNDVEWQPLGKAPGGMRARVRATIRNFGASTSVDSGPLAIVLGNAHPLDETREPSRQLLGDVRPIRSLAPGESQEFEWECVIPGDVGYYPVTISLRGTDDEVDHTNDTVTHWFKN